MKDVWRSVLADNRFERRGLDFLPEGLQFSYESGYNGFDSAVA